MDFLSTVSGGGYIGSHLSSLVLREDTSMEKGKFPLREEPGGKQPARVVQFLRNGRYMVAHPFALYRSVSGRNTPEQCGRAVRHPGDLYASRSAMEVL